MGEARTVPLKHPRQHVSLSLGVQPEKGDIPLVPKVSESGGRGGGSPWGDVGPVLFHGR